MEEEEELEELEEDEDEEQPFDSPQEKEHDNPQGFEASHSHEPEEEKTLSSSEPLDKVVPDDGPSPEELDENSLSEGTDHQNLESLKEEEEENSGTSENQGDSEEIEERNEKEHKEDACEKRGDRRTNEREPQHSKRKMEIKDSRLSHPQAPAKRPRLSRGLSSSKPGRPVSLLPNHPMFQTHPVPGAPHQFIPPSPSIPFTTPGSRPLLPHQNKPPMVLGTGPPLFPLSQIPYSGPPLKDPSVMSSNPPLRDSSGRALPFGPPPSLEIFPPFSVVAHQHMPPNVPSFPHGPMIGISGAGRGVWRGGGPPRGLSVGPAGNFSQKKKNLRGLPLDGPNRKIVGHTLPSLPPTSLPGSKNAPAPYVSLRSSDSAIPRRTAPLPPAPLSSSSGSKRFNGPSSSLTITSLPKSVTLSDISSLFGEVGPVRGLSLAHGRARVEYLHPKDALAAKRRFHKSMVKGSIINVNIE